MSSDLSPIEDPSSPSRWAWTESVRRWLTGRRGVGHADGAIAASRPRFRNLCISREVGSSAGTIARIVGTRLDWKVFDHELLEAIAHRMEVPVDEAKTFDELAPSVIQDWLLPVREEHYAPHEAYLDHLSKLVQAIGRAGDSIIVGRGAGFLLPRDETLSVRIFAPLKVRARRVADRMGVSLRTARGAVREQDARFRKFIRVMYRQDPDDPHVYDLVLDSDSLGLEIASEILVRAILAGRNAPPHTREVDDRPTGAGGLGLTHPPSPAPPS